MVSMTDVTCPCGNTFQARTAAVKRGWGIYCSKSCKQTFQGSTRSNIEPQDDLARLALAERRIEVLEGLLRTSLIAMKRIYQAGTILGITEATTNAHIASAAVKLHASNRAHLITRAFVAGVLAPVAKLILLLSVLISACNGDMDDARAPRPVRRRDDTCVVEKPARVGRA